MQILIACNTHKYTFMAIEVHLFHSLYINYIFLLHNTTILRIIYTYKVSFDLISISFQSFNIRFSDKTNESL